jgi:hypothetical protein
MGQLSYVYDVRDNVYDNCSAGSYIRNCRILKESCKENYQLLTQLSVKTLSLGDINLEKEDHYFELVLSLTTHNKKPYFLCMPFPNPSAPYTQRFTPPEYESPPTFLKSLSLSNRLIKILME